MKNQIKLFAALLITGLSSSTINAQTTSTSTEPQYGVKGGVNFSNIYSSEVDDNNVLTSFNVGVFAIFPISDAIAIQPELLYSRKGSKTTYDNAIASGNAQFKLNYLELPVLVKVNLTENLSLHAGPYFAYLIDAQIKNETDGGNFDFEDNYDNDDFNKFDAGLSAGIGFDFDSFGIGARYNYGLTKIGKEQNIGNTTYTPEGKNSNLSVYATFSIN